MLAPRNRIDGLQMFSLIITVISVALVAALALATLYYGGDAYESGQAKAEAAKLRNQGQQLVAAAEFYYLQKGEWPETIQKMVDDGFLTTVPVAQRTAIQEALAGRAWVMPVARQPLFTFDEVTSEVCSTLNQDSYGLKGILPKLQPGYMHQCFGPTKNDLLVVVGRGSLPDLVAAVNEGLLVPENVSSDPIPDPDDTGAWTLSPKDAGSSTGGDTGEPGDPGDTNPPPTDPDPVTPGQIRFGHSEVDFRSVATHTTRTKEVVVSNTGGQAAALDVPALSGDPEFSISSTTCGPTLEPGTSCSVMVSYSPTVVSAGQSATLTILEGVSLELTAKAYNPVSLQSATLPVGKLNRVYTPVSFSNYFDVSNEVSPDLGQVVWEVQGTLPSGLTFDDQTGTLSGTPTSLTSTAGQDFTVLATYKSNLGQQVYTIRVGEAVLDAIAVSAGANHTCAVTSAGAVKCWGYNQYGQLGNGLTSNSSAPVQVTGLTSGVVSVEAGGFHSCALLANGTVKCWGLNGAGQLGAGLAATSSYTPVDVVGVTSGQQISVGNAHACVIEAGNVLKCWGDNGYGRLGNGTNVNARSPLAVTGLPSGALQVSAGHSHTCAISGTQVAYCWGRNDNRQVGDGTSTGRLSPVPVLNMPSPASRIYASREHSCSISAAGALYCWGYSNYGRVDGTTAIRPSAVLVHGLTTGVKAAALGYHHTCFVTTQGAVKCYGSGSGGKLGNGSGANQTAPVTVLGLESGVTALTSEDSHTCAIDSNGGLRCWGSNTQGQLGDGSTTEKYSPVAVID